MSITQAIASAKTHAKMIELMQGVIDFAPIALSVREIVREIVETQGGKSPEKDFFIAFAIGMGVLSDDLPDYRVLLPLFWDLFDLQEEGKDCQEFCENFWQVCAVVDTRSRANSSSGVKISPGFLLDCYVSNFDPKEMGWEFRDNPHMFFEIVQGEKFFLHYLDLN